MLRLDYSENAINRKFIQNKKVIKRLNSASVQLFSMDKSIGTGWVELPNEITKQEIARIKDVAKNISTEADLFIVIGIGGSSAGAEAGVSLLKKCKTEIVFIGNNYDSRAIADLLEHAKNKNVYVNCISKSGDTLETLVTFKIIEDFLKKKYKKKEYVGHIIITTDYEKGVLRDIASTEGYESFVIPRTIGGRYSLFTPVGLLPMAVAGINIEKVLNGAKDAYKKCKEPEISSNPAVLYALIRNYLYAKKKKMVELISSFNEKYAKLFDWWEQLFVESEGKDKKGLFVSSLIYPNKLHSFEQFIQNGTPIIFETILDEETNKNDLSFVTKNEDKILPNLAEINFHSIKKASTEAVIKAHIEAGVPLVKFSLDELTEESFGYLAYTLMYSAAISGFMMGVNPFNQPDVDKYKNITKSLINSTSN